VPATDPRRPGDFDHVDVLQHEGAGQPGAVAAGALDTGAAHRPEPLCPADQSAHTAAGGRERLAGNETAEQVDEHGGVGVAVGIDAEDDFGGEAWHG